MHTQCRYYLHCPARFRRKYLHHVGKYLQKYLHKYLQAAHENKDRTLVNRGAPDFSRWGFPLFILFARSLFISALYFYSRSLFLFWCTLGSWRGTARAWRPYRAENNYLYLYAAPARGSINCIQVYIGRLRAKLKTCMQAQWPYETLFLHAPVKEMIGRDGGN